jgi:hypothetical protein
MTEKCKVVLKNIFTEEVNTYSEMYIALFDQFVIQSQGFLNLCCSVNIQFPVNS